MGDFVANEHPHPHPPTLSFPARQAHQTLFLPSRGEAAGWGENSKGDEWLLKMRLPLGSAGLLCERLGSCGGLSKEPGETPRPAPKTGQGAVESRVGKAAGKSQAHFPLHRRFPLKPPLSL